MNIAFFTNTYAPYVNGVANSVKAFREGLVGAGHDVIVFAPMPMDKSFEEDDDEIVRFPGVPVPGDYDYGLAVPFAPRVVKALKNAKFDIVHTQHPLWVGTWGAWYARWMDIPHVTTVHTQYELYSHLIPLPEPLVDMYLRMQVTRFCNKCQAVTTPAESARQRLLQQGVTTPIEILPNPVDVARFAEADGQPMRDSLGIPPGEVVLGFVGRLAPEKNLEFLLRAAAKVLRRVPRTRFLMVGGGVQLDLLEEQAEKLGVSDRVIFTGEVEHSQVAEYQAAMDVFVATSLSEGQPMAYTEAMAAGTPIIALRAPGATDMIVDGQNGLLIDPDDGVDGMAGGLIRVAGDPALLRGLADGAREWAKRYDLATITEQLLATYDTATRRKLEESKG